MRVTVMATSSAMFIVCLSGCDLEYNRIEIEMYPLQKGGLRTSFSRWGVTFLLGCHLMSMCVMECVFRFIYHPYSQCIIVFDLRAV